MFTLYPDFFSLLEAEEVTPSVPKCSASYFF
jgi:hypothetical protein